MKITKVEPIVLRFWDVPEKAGYTDAMLVRVETDEGIEGIGEIDGPPLVQLGLIRTVHPGTWWRGLEERLVGENPLEIDRLWDKMYSHSIFYGRAGLIVSAVSGLDFAIWDIAGKHYGEPVYRLLGGRGKQGSGIITPYASVAPFGSSEEEVAKKCRELVKKAGYIAAKFHNHPMGVDDKKALRLIKRAREELGNSIAMMLDAANHYETKDAIKFARSIEPYDIYFLEAPLHCDNLEGYAKLTSSTTVQIAAGEEQTTRLQFIELMDNGMVDVIQPDPIWVGGLTECRRIVRLAQDRGVLFVPHCDKSAINYVANLHLGAAVPNCPYAESPISTPPVYKAIVNERFEPGSDGRIKLPERPGLGITLNKKLIEKYRVDISDFHYRAPTNRR